MESTALTWNQTLADNLPSYNTSLALAPRKSLYTTKDRFQGMSPDQKTAVIGLAFVHTLSQKEGYLLRCLFVRAGQAKAAMVTLSNDPRRATTRYVFTLTTRLDDHRPFPECVRSVKLEIKWSGNQQAILWPATQDQTKVIDNLNALIIFKACQKGSSADLLRAYQFGGMFTYHEKQGTLIQGDEPKPLPQLRLPTHGPAPHGEIPDVWKLVAPRTIREQRGSLGDIREIHARLKSLSSDDTATLADEDLASLEEPLGDAGVSLEVVKDQKYIANYGSVVVQFGYKSVRRLLSHLVNTTESEEVGRIIERLRAKLPPLTAPSEEAGGTIQGVLGELDEALTTAMLGAAAASDEETLELTEEEAILLLEALEQIAAGQAPKSPLPFLVALAAVGALALFARHYRLSLPNAGQKLAAS